MEAVLVRVQRGFQRLTAMPWNSISATYVFSGLGNFQKIRQPTAMWPPCLCRPSLRIYRISTYVSSSFFFSYGYKLIRLLNFYVGCFLMRATPPIMTCLKLYPLRFPWRICNTWFILFIHLLILLVHTRCLICMKLCFRFDNRQHHHISHIFS